MANGTGGSSPVTTSEPPPPAEQAPERATPTPRRRRRRWVRWALIGAGAVLALLAVATADAYHYAYSTVDELRQVADGLDAAKNSLAKGRLFAGDPFAQAEQAVQRIRAELDGARPTFGFVGAIPFLGRPVTAVRALLDASEHEVLAANDARDLIDDLTGGALSATRSDAGSERHRCSEEPTPEAVQRCHDRKHGETGTGGSGGSDTLPRSPLFAGGTLDLAKLASFQPALRRVVGELRAAEAAVERVPTAPFISKATELKNDLLDQVGQARRTGESALLGMRLLPALLGDGGPRRYFVAFGDLSYIRGAGGSTLAYAILTADHGHLEVSQSQQVFRFLDDQVDIPVDVPRDNWYLRKLKSQVRLGNANYSPNFPSSAVVMARIYEYLKHEHLDGLIQVDAPAVANMLRATGPLEVPGWPDRITASNVTQVAYIDSHVAFKEGPARKQLSSQLVKEAWRRIANPTDGLQVLSAAVQLGRALQEKHLQVWLADPAEQGFATRLGWTGAIRPAAGDYVYVAEDEQSTDALAFFATQDVEHHVVVRADGDLVVTTTVTDRVDLPEQYRVRPIISKNGAKRAVLVNLYTPGDSRHLATTHESAKGVRFPATVVFDNQEAGRHVLSALTRTPPDEQSSLIFRYVVPDGLVQTSDGLAYQLTYQIQPTVNLSTLHLTVQLPAGMSVGDLPRPFEVDGHTVTLTKTLDADGTITIPLR
jgi:Protein of unknown function (DUF4012)